MYDDMQMLIAEVRKLSADERGPYVTWLIVWMIRDVAYYIVAGLVAWALGRRLIQAIAQAMRESRSERA